MIRLSAPLTIEASAAGTPKRLRIIAYTGGIVRVSRFGAMVFELSGMQIPVSIPLVADHQLSLGAMVGSGRPESDGKTLTVLGTAADTEPGRQVIGLLEAGHPLQASVGLAADFTSEFVPAGKTIRANGRNITAPADGFQWVKVSRLIETSVVPSGADSNTTVNIAASAARRGPMEFTTWLGSMKLDPNAISAEQRTALQAEHTKLYPPPSPASDTWDSAALLAKEAPHLVAQAARERWGDERCRIEASAAMRQKLDKATGGIHARNPDRDSGHQITRDHLVAAVMVRAGQSKAAENAYGATLMEQSRPFQRMSMPDLAAAAMELDGQQVPRDRHEMIQAGLSTLIIPTLLGDSANKILETQWRLAEPTWKSWCAIRSAKDFKTNTSIRPAFSAGLEPLGAGGKIKHGTMTEEYFTWALGTFAKMFSFDRKQLVNDDLSALAEVVPALGNAAMRTLADLVYANLMANPSSFFHTNHANIQTGGDSPLSSTSLALAIKKLRLQTDPDGNVLNLPPAVLVVPPSLEQTARGLLNSAEVLRDASDDSQPTGNTLQGAARLEVEARLEAGVVNPTSRQTVTGSAVKWYLFCGPADVPAVVGYLDGRESPIVETFGLDHDASTLAMTFRCYHDFATALGDYRAAQYSAGA